MNILHALASIIQPTNILWFVLGNVIGIIAGILPGIGASLTMALLIPITFFLPPETGLITLVSAWSGATYGGSITSILINTPGTGANVATCFDGFPMTRQGKAKTALGISATASAIGGLIGVACLILFSPFLAALAVKFGPSEYFMLTIFGMAVTSTTSRGAAVKGLIAAGIGLVISFVGNDIITGELRYNFGTVYLQDGINFLCIVIGLFAVAQVLEFLSEKGSISLTDDKDIKGSIMEGVLYTFKRPFVLLKSALIGVVFGFAPGVGTSAASLVAYSETQATSKDPDSFGKGNPDGIIAPEAAACAVQGGALIPALTLGIPGNSDSAVFLAGLMMYGIMPGKDLFRSNSSLVYMLFVALVISQIMFWCIGLGLTNIFEKITRVPVKMLIPLVWLVAATGGFALKNNLVDLVTILIIGVVGLIMRKLGYPAVPVLIAAILGPIAEKNFDRALMIYDNDYTSFIKGPINIVILILIIGSLVYPMFMTWKRKQAQKKEVNQSA